MNCFFSYSEKKHSTPVIKNVLYGICHRLKKCSFIENIITGNGNIIEVQKLVGHASFQVYLHACNIHGLGHFPCMLHPCYMKNYMHAMCVYHFSKKCSNFDTCTCTHVGMHIIQNKCLYDILSVYTF